MQFQFFSAEASKQKGAGQVKAKNRNRPLTFEKLAAGKKNELSDWEGGGNLFKKPSWFEFLMFNQ